MLVSTAAKSKANRCLSQSNRAGEKVERRSNSKLYISKENPNFQGPQGSPWAKVLALWWSSFSLVAISTNAIFPAAAKMPTCLSPPPRALRHLTAWDMKPRGPASIVPKGAPSPCHTEHCKHCRFRLTENRLCPWVAPWTDTRWLYLCAAGWWSEEHPGPQQRSSPGPRPCEPTAHACRLRLGPWRGQ